MVRTFPRVSEPCSLSPPRQRRGRIEFFPEALVRPIRYRYHNPFTAQERARRTGSAGAPDFGHLGERMSMAGTYVRVALGCGASLLALGAANAQQTAGAGSSTTAE